MSHAVQLFPIAIGSYQNFDDLAVDEELAAVHAALAEFECQVVGWECPQPARGADSVNERLRDWSRLVHPQAVLYWVGHGWSDGKRVALAHAKSPRQVGTEGIEAARIAEAVAAREVDETGWTLVIVDACQSRDFIRKLKDQLNELDYRQPYLLLGGLSGDGATELGVLSSRLRSVLGTTCAADYEIPLRNLAYHFEYSGADVETKFLLDVSLRRRHAVVANIPLDARNELDAALALLSDDELRHFVPKAHGGELPFQETTLNEQSWYFEGRVEETRQLAEWLSQDTGGLLVVTGPAGSGKSALLGHLVVHANPTLRSALQRAGLLTPIPDRPPDNVFDVVLQLTGASTDEVLHRIARALHLGTPPVNDVALAEEWFAQKLWQRADPATRAAVVEPSPETIRSSTLPMTILADALDEAVEPLTVARVLRRLANAPGIRIIVGTRVSTSEGPDRPAPDADLLDALAVLDPLDPLDPPGLIRVDAEPAAVRRYVAHRLLDVQRRRARRPGMDIEAFAEAAAARNPQFVTARLLVHEVASDARWHSAARWQELLDRDHQQLFGLALDRLAAVDPHYRQLLMALAFARGRGLPAADGIWATVAHALVPSQACDLADIERLLVAAAPYVIVDREHEQTIYRLAHRTFAEHFTIETKPSEFDRTKHLAITMALADTAARLTAEAAESLNPYLKQFLSAHAAQAGQVGWDLLERSDRVLPYLDPDQLAADVLRTLFGRFPIPPAIGGMITMGSELRNVHGVGRDLLVRLAKARHVGRYRATADELRSDRSVTLMSARFTTRPVHRTFEGPGCPVQAITALHLPDGRVQLAGGYADATIWTWDLMTGRSLGGPFHVGGQVSALAAVPLVDGRNILAGIIIGNGGPELRLWDPNTGLRYLPIGAETSISSGRRRADKPTALIVVPLADGRHLFAAVGFGKNTRAIQLWDPNTLLPHGDPIRVPDGLAAVAVYPKFGRRPAALATATVNGTLQLWDPATSAPLGGRHKTKHPISGMSLVRSADQHHAFALLIDGPLIGVWEPTLGSRLEVLACPVRMAPLVTVPLLTGRTLFVGIGPHSQTYLWSDSPAPQEPDLLDVQGTASTLATIEMPDESVLFATGQDTGEIKVWDPIRAESGGDEHAPTYHAAISAVTRKDGRTLLVTGTAAGLHWWDPMSAEPVHGMAEANGGIRCLARFEYGTGENLLAVAGWSGTMVSLIDPETGQQLEQPYDGRVGPAALAFLPLQEGRSLLVVGSHHTVQLWALFAGGRLRDTLWHEGAVHALATLPLPTGATLLAACGQGKVRVWDLDPEQYLPSGSQRPDVGFVETITALRLHDGRTLLVCSTNQGTLRFWDPVTETIATDLPDIRLGAAPTALCAVDTGLLAAAFPNGFAVIRITVPESADGPGHTDPSGRSTP